MLALYNNYYILKEINGRFKKNNKFKDLIFIKN